MKMKKEIVKNAQRYFATGVSMITSVGHKGKNVMAAEWTMQISHNPMLIAVFIHKESATLTNILKTKEFGINVASDEQTTLVSISGGYSRNEIDKLSMSDFFKLIKSQKIKPPLIDGCVINAECKLFTTKRIGDHTMVVGKVASIKYDKTKKPLIYHQGKYFGIGSTIQPVRQKVKVNQKIFNLFQRESQGKFILKCVGTIVRIRDEIIVTSNFQDDLPFMIPYVVPQNGQNQKYVLEKYLEKTKLNIVLKQKPSIKRLVLQRNKKIQRVNFIIFNGVLKNRSANIQWKSVKNDLFLQTLIK